MKTFCIGDIHGAHKALVQCLDRSGFDKENDLLITLGDICDGWPYVYECVEELLTIKNRIDLIGNHDEWFKRWLLTTQHPDRWTQGGIGTYISYERNMERMDVGLVPASHWKFFQYQVPYYKDDERNAFFVHGGFDRYKSIADNKADDPMIFYWDRELWERAKSCKGEQKLQTVEDFKTIFIGHTSCFHLRRGLPCLCGGVWNLDTGAGWEGKLTIMDIDTKQFWQSDMVEELYPEDTSRRSNY